MIGLGQPSSAQEIVGYTWEQMVTLATNLDALTTSHVPTASASDTPWCIGGQRGHTSHHHTAVWEVQHLLEVCRMCAK